MNEVLLFKTNIASEEDEERLAPLLDNHNAISKWNVDREDIDNVLRVETKELDAPGVIVMVTATGFKCEELED